MTLLYATAEPKPANVSGWHWWWQTAVPEAQRTQQRGKYFPDAVAATGDVVEIQYSNIKAAIIADRERHYGRLVWLFDAREAHASGRLVITTPTSAAPVPYRWTREPGFMRQCRRPVFLDLGVSARFGEHLVYRLPDLYDRTSKLGTLHTVESVRSWMGHGIDLTPWRPSPPRVPSARAHRA